jgi:diguanylate cyclase (GGDEF)-like protein
MLAVVGLTVGVSMIALRRYVGAFAAHSLLVLATALVSMLVASSATPAGVALTGVDYMCVGWISAYFFTRRAARVHCALAIAGFATAVAAGGVPGLATPALVIAATVVASSEMLAHFVTQLRRQASLDSLTGLANRASFKTAAEREMARAATGSAGFAVAMIDLDDFKLVNDMHGHLAGDALLIELADRWQAQLRDKDVLSRFGGDEFALLMPHTTRRQGDHLLDRLREAHPARWSAGVVEWDGDANVDQMLRRADRDLYKAKASREVRAARA